MAVDIDELRRCCELIERYDWSVVLLAARSKRPSGSSWHVTKDTAAVAQHVRSGGNLGLVCGRLSGVDVLDFDDLEGAQALFRMLGELPVSVVTGSGKWHVYVRHDGGTLPAKIKLGSRIVGEIQRGPNQQVVMPPSVHPDTGRVYRWVGCEVNCSILPDTWREYFTDFQDGSRPDFLTIGDVRGTPNWKDEWEGPSPEVLLRRAMMMPNAKRRAGGVKFKCPGCVADGRDKHADNAIVRNDGRWGCAVTYEDPSHRRAIGVALGVIPMQGKMHGPR